MTASLTFSKACAIRQAHAEGSSVRELAQQYNVGFETIRRILRWETWRQPPADQTYGPVDEGASLARLQAKLAAEGAGDLVPAREAAVAVALEEEVSSLRRGDNLLKELGKP